MTSETAISRSIQRPRKRPSARSVVPFDWKVATEFALQSLYRPAPLDRIKRPKCKGRLIENFVLPLELCQPQNRTRGQHGNALARLKRRVFEYMSMQTRPRSSPLPGRPQVVCVRFSSVEPDAFNDGFKMAVDCLGPMVMPPATTPGARRKLGLWFIQDDSPKCIDLHQRWEPAPPRIGFGYIEIWSGAR